KAQGIGLVATAVLAVGCTGVIDGDGSGRHVGDGGNVETQQICGVGPNPMRRLTAPEYQNTVRDLFGSVSVDLTKLLLPDVEISGLRNNVTAQLWTLAHAQQYLSVADTLVADAVRDLGKLVGCDWTVKGESACAGDFITRFGKRVYRRPLTPAEESTLRTVYDTGRNGADFKTGISATLTAMLMAPQFLHRLELQPGVARPDGTIPLSGYELAS